MSVMSDPQRTLSIYGAKATFVKGLSGLERALERRGVAPNTVTAWSIPLGIGAGVAVALGTVNPLIWLAVPPLALTRMALNAIDGELARRSGATTTGGAILNELADRIGDVAMGVAAFAVVSPWLAVTALLAVLAAEYVSVLGWGITGNRRFAGPMGKPDRALVVSAGAVLALFVGAAWTVTFALIAAGSLIAVGVRLKDIGV